MRKQIFLGLVLFLSLVWQSGLTQAQGQTLQSRDEIAAVVNKLAFDYRINIVYDYKPSATWDIGGKPADEGDWTDLGAFVSLLDEELRKYPKSFIHNTHLGLIVLVKGLAIDKQARAAMPDYYRQTLWLDFKDYRKDGAYQRHTIHHEFYHLIDFELSRRAYWQDPAWMSLNQPPTYKYGNGGVTAYTDHNSAWAYENHPAPGFINRYATTGVEEDKAEIFAYLFLKREQEQLTELMKTDAVLRAKTDYMKAIVRRLDSTMNETYWQTVVATKPKLVPQDSSKPLTVRKNGF